MLHLSAHEAHLHVMRGDAFAAISEAELVSRYGKLLSPGEREKRGRFLFETKRREYLMTRVLVRTVLSRYANVAPRSWGFGVTPYGRPFIASPGLPAPIEFNISNTDGLIVCLVARIPEIGVDVESTSRRAQIMNIAERYFSTREVVALKALSGSQQRERFYAYWTLKEAYIKARGSGFAIPLNELSFNVDPCDITVTFGSSITDEPSAWQFARWALFQRHECATAIRSDAPIRIAIRPVEEIPLLVGE